MKGMTLIIFSILIGVAHATEEHIIDLPPRGSDFNTEVFFVPPLPLPEQPLDATFHFSGGNGLRHVGNKPLVFLWTADQNFGGSDGSVGTVDYLDASGGIIVTVSLLRQDFPFGFQESQIALSNASASVPTMDFFGMRFRAPAYESPATEMESESGEMEIGYKSSRDGRMVVIPEPSTLPLLVLGLFVFTVIAWCVSGRFRNSSKGQK